MKHTGTETEISPFIPSSVFIAYRCHFDDTYRSVSFTPTFGYALLLMRLLVLISFITLFISGCHETHHNQHKILVRSYVTTIDQRLLLHPDSISFAEQLSGHTLIKIDTSKKFQEVEGFGYTLTGGSASLINSMSAQAKEKLLQELFGKNSDAMQISYLRISIGASDLHPEAFSYDDPPAGIVDTHLRFFNLGPDTMHVIPLLKRILEISPHLRIMATPWSAPAWMKSTKTSIGGSLLPEYYETYAAYFVKYLQEMHAHGITIDAITVQNEPQHGGNNPSMVMSADEQALFIKRYLGPALRGVGLQTKIIIWDHNCDMPEFPITVLDDPEAKEYIHGSAFHLYNGDITALSVVHDAHPDRHLYFTEQWTGARGGFDGDFQWHLKHVIIGSMRNWSRTALEWNLASDPRYSIHTPGGCTECKGALTIDGDIVSKNVGYYIIVHASRFVPPGSIRVSSTFPESIPNVAFITPGGKTVLIVLNENKERTLFTVTTGSNHFEASLEPGSAGTYVW